MPKSLNWIICYFFLANICSIANASVAQDINLSKWKTPTNQLIFKVIAYKENFQTHQHSVALTETVLPHKVTSSVESQNTATNLEQSKALQNQIKESWILATLCLITAILFFSLLYRYRKLKKHVDNLTRLSQTDKLTGLYNRVKTDEALTYHLNCFQRYEDVFSIILLDIDDFKSINDEFGHMVGDQTLVNFARVISECCRKTDIVGRWGGEEFLIVCPKANLATAKQITEKLQASIRQISVNNTSKQHLKPVTASFGLTEVRKQDTHNSLILRADLALLNAKQNGKNQYISAATTDLNEVANAI